VNFTFKFKLLLGELYIFTNSRVKTLCMPLEHRSCLDFGTEGQPHILLLELPYNIICTIRKVLMILCFSLSYLGDSVRFRNSINNIF
jgi:hypothetical protein